MARIRNKLHRQFKRYLGTEDPSNIVAGMRGQAEAGGHDDCVAFFDGLPGFFEAVARTYEEYEDKNKMALRNLDISSEELNSANSKLERLNRSMEAMLESLGPALLFFNKGGLCADTFSRSCLDLLECEPAGAYIWDVLNCGDDARASLEKLLTLAFKNISAMTVEDLFKIAPQYYPHSKGLVISLKYKPIFGGSGALQGILLIAEDITEEVHYKALANQREMHSKKILRLIQNRKDYLAFLGQVEEFFLSENPLFYEQISLFELKGDLHTFKGLAGSFYLDDFAEIIQNLETLVVQEGMTLRNAFGHIEEAIPEIFSTIEGARDFVQSLFGDGGAVDPNLVQVRRDELISFFKALSMEEGVGALKDLYYKTFLTVPIKDLLLSLDQHIRETAGRLGKSMKSSRLEGDTFSLPVGVYDDVFSTFVHLVRNAIDHGIESPEERERNGKAREGQIMVRAETFDNQGEPWFRIIFRDDGAGINAQNIRERMAALEQDSTGIKDEEVIQNIFMPGFSSKRGVSIMSGRGVGLSAISKEVRKLGGSISVSSEPGKGTTFAIDLPILDDVAIRG